MHKRYEATVLKSKYVVVDNRCNKPLCTCEEPNKALLIEVALNTLDHNEVKLQNLKTAQTI